MPYIYTSDAYSPREIARRVEEVGVLKAKARFIETFMLGILAGGFIGLGGLLFTFVVATDPGYDVMSLRLLGGVLFASGYIIAILAGTEVFTSNNLLAMAAASRRITLRQLLRNWYIVLLANALGALGLGVLFILSGLQHELDGAVGQTAYAVAAEKGNLSIVETFSRAILGNLFVCIAVWISLGGRSVTDKVIGAMPPLIALGALSLEHVAASLYYLPRGALIAWLHPEYIDPSLPALTWGTAFLNLGPVIAGNIIGGSVMVAIVYHLIYGRHHAEESADRDGQG